MPRRRSPRSCRRRARARRRPCARSSGAARAPPWRRRTASARPAARRRDELRRAAIMSEGYRSRTAGVQLLWRAGARHGRRAAATKRSSSRVALTPDGLWSGSGGPAPGQPWSVPDRRRRSTRRPASQPPIAHAGDEPARGASASAGRRSRRGAPSARCSAGPSRRGPGACRCRGRRCRRCRGCPGTSARAPPGTGRARGSRRPPGRRRRSGRAARRPCGRRSRRRWRRR